MNNFVILNELQAWPDCDLSLRADPHQRQEDRQLQGPWTAIQVQDWQGRGNFT